MKFKVGDVVLITEVSKYNGYYKEYLGLIGTIVDIDCDRLQQYKVKVDGQIHQIWCCGVELISSKLDYDLPEELFII